MKTILFVTHVESLYGANKALLNHILNIKDIYNVLVLSPKSGDFSLELNNNNIPTLNYFFSTWGYNPNSLKSFIHSVIKYIFSSLIYIFLLKKLKKLSIDLIHTNSSVINIGAKISKSLKKPHVWHIREFGVLDYNFKQGFYSNHYKYIARNSTRIILVSMSVFNHFLEGNQKNDYLDIYSKSDVIYDGIPKLNNVIEKNRMSNHINKATKFISVGLLQPKKNQLLALKALSYMVNYLDIKDIYLDIYGSGAKNYIDKLKRFVKENSISDYVKFKGFDSNISNCLSQYDVGLMTSTNEAYGLVTVEFMRSSLPVIGINSGGTKELILDGINGYLVDGNDYISLANKMNLFVHNKDLVSKMGSKSQQMYEEKYNLNNSTKMIKIIYEKVI